MKAATRIFAPETPGEIGGITPAPATFTTLIAATAAPGTNTTQVATTAFAAAAVAAAVTSLLEFKGSTDASSNPNYPAADKGDTYYITVAGKIGGASGKSVEVGDAVVASADNAGGTEAGVGTSWFVLEHNLAGALVTANNLSELTATASTARTNLGLGALATLADAPAGTLTGTTLNATVVTSSLTTVGTIGHLLTVGNQVKTTGSNAGFVAASRDGAAGYTFYSSAQDDFNVYNNAVGNILTYTASTNSWEFGAATIRAKGAMRSGDALIATLEASTPNYLGQLGMSQDGWIAGSYGTTAADWSRLAWLDPLRAGEPVPLIFQTGRATQFPDLTFNFSNATQIDAPFAQLRFGSTKSDDFSFRCETAFPGNGVGGFVNVVANGISGFDCWEYPNPGGSGGFTFARGNPLTGNGFNNTCVIESFFGDGGTGLIDGVKASPIAIRLHGYYGAAEAGPYARVKFDTDGQIIFYKLTPGKFVYASGVAMYIDPTGTVGIGTSTLATGAALTVNGAIAVGGTSVYSESTPTTFSPVGYGTVGISSTGILRRFETGIQVGGSASNPGQPNSRIGTGVHVEDCDAISVRVAQQASGIVSPTVTNPGDGNYHTPPAVTVPAAPAGGVTATASAYMTETSLHRTAAQITATTGGTGYNASEVVTVSFAEPINETGRPAKGTLTANGSGVIAAATAVVFGGSATGTIATDAAGAAISCVLTAGGSAFPKSQTDMEVSLVAGGNRTAGALADTDANGVITGLSFKDAGAGYTASQGALAVTIDAFGAKYGTLPLATVTPPVTGITPRVTAKLNPTTLAQIIVIDPGKKYNSGGSFTIDNTGTGGASGAATYSAVMPITGRGVYEYRMTIFGSGYNPNSPPTVTVAPPPSGTTATAQAVVNAEGQITNITALIPGGPYGLVPGVTVAAPGTTAATGTATQTGGVMNDPVLTSGGWGYFLPPSSYTVTINGTGGTGAAAVIKTIVGGVITELQRTAGGTGYTGGSWAITISAPAAGTTATATANLGGLAQHTEPDGGDHLHECRVRVNYLNEISGGSDWKFSHLRGGNTLDQQGIAAPTSVPAAPTSVIDADGDWLHYASAATINLVSGAVAASFGITRRDFRPVLIAYIKIGAAITNSRNWVCWNSAIMTDKDVPTTAHVCGFRYASVTDTTAFWRFVTSAGSTPTTIITPFPIAVNTAYELIVDMSTFGVARGYINGQLAATVDTTLPTSTTPLGWTAAVTNVTGTAHEMKIAHVRGKQRS